jgi:multicomponent Na+:H+ antiporter subunit E
MKNLYRFLATAAAAFLLYILLTMSVALPEIILGVAVALFTALVVVRYLPFTFQVFHPRRILRAVMYTPVFVWKMILANLHIAGIVVRPRLPIKPSIVRARTGVDTSFGKVLLTSSITLTPGTLSVDTKDDIVYVHLVDSEATSDSDARTNIIVPFEKYIKGISE